MEFKQENEDLNFIEQQLATPPVVNVITKEEFEERVYTVFTILWEKLAKSFGPGGAGTFISVYPAYYNTKDGFTIMKNIAFDKKLDQVISDMVSNVCNRLNFTVGDGTTTAVIATKSTYESYVKNKKFFENNNLLPRDILARFEKYKNILLEKLSEKSIDIRSDNPEELKKNIEKVVYISSNGNEELTDMISSLYEKLMYPAITCVMSSDGTMKSSIVEGFESNVSLTDKMYINNDNNTMLLPSGADVIMFDHKVTRETYEKILKPLSDACKGRGRHLICIAPYYDETALSGIIGMDLNAEYKRTQNINLVLTVCSKLTGEARTSLEDLAMLLNTKIITSSVERDFIEILNNGENIYKLFDMDNRGIPGITVCVMEGDDRLRPVSYNEGLENIFNYYDPNQGIRLGYAGNVEVGLKNTRFSEFYYDKSLYEKTLSIAKSELTEVQKKCEKIGTFSLELTSKQKRVYALGLKTGLIEVGADSELSQGYLKDTVDDAVKAAASAYNNGVVLGCNVTLMQSIKDLISDPECDDIDIELLTMLLNGFKNVYSTVFSNVFSDRNIVQDIDNVLKTENVSGYFTKEVSKYIKVGNDFHLDNDTIRNKMELSHFDNLYDFLIEYSILSGQVFDLSTNTFNKTVINSSETDKEILKATIDLLSLLITGNQLVLR